jgi:hypothetical protein
MRKWMLWGVALALLLALSACGGDKKEPAGELPTPTAALDVTPTGAPAALGFGNETPGLQARQGLTVLRESAGAHGDTVYFFAEVRNDSGQVLARVDSTLFALDNYGVRVGEFSANPLLSDIPAGAQFFVGGSFPKPDLYSDSRRWIWFTAAPQASLNAIFDLPTTITERSVTEAGLYRVTGTATNTTDQELVFPLIDVAAIGPDDDLAGLAHAVVTTSRPDQRWQAGETVTFVTQFSFLTVPVEQITDVAVQAVGYAIPTPGG